MSAPPKSKLCIQLGKYFRAKEQTGIIWGYSYKDWSTMYADSLSSIFSFCVHAGSYVNVTNPEMLRLKDEYKGCAEWVVYVDYEHCYHPLPSQGIVNWATRNPTAELFVKVRCDFP